MHEHFKVDTFVNLISFICFKICFSCFIPCYLTLCWLTVSKHISNFSFLTCYVSRLNFVHLLFLASLVTCFCVFSAFFYYLFHLFQSCFTEFYIEKCWFYCRHGDRISERERWINWLIPSYMEIG